MAGLENPEKHTEAPQCGERSAQAPQHRGRAQGVEGDPHKSPQHRGQGWGAEKRSTQSPHLASFDLQCRARPGDRSTSKDPRDRGRMQWGYAERAAPTRLQKQTRPPLRSQEDCPQTCRTHRKPKPTTGHCAALRRWDPLHQPEHRHKLPQPGKHHRTLIQTHPQGRLHSQENYVLSSLLNHTVHTPYIFLPLH